MTAALIFRRQLVRPKALNLQQALSASKLPLEKFHRLLDLVLLGKFLKLSSISDSVLFWELYRVSLAPVACGALNLKCAAGGGKGHNQLTPPRPTISDR